MLALTAHVHECARTLLPHLPQNLTAVHAPVARPAIESALTVMWIDKKPDAVAAFNSEDQRQRQNIANTLRAQGRSEEAERIAHIADEPWPATKDSLSEARRFEDLTKRLGAEDVYLVYRVLCGITHPSPFLADEYLAMGNGARPFEFTPHPEPLEMSESMTWLIATSMLWSARRVDYLDGKNARRNTLRAYGHELGTSPDAGN